MYGVQDMENRRLKKQGITPVISALILSAAVLVVGGALWFYSQSAMSISADDYANSVIENTNAVSERYIIEHVAYNEGTDTLRVWIYDYGPVDIEVKVQVGTVTQPENPDEWEGIAKGILKEIDLSYTANSGDELSITAYTRRENNVYYRFYIP